jgi:hypothetical protein
MNAFVSFGSPKAATDPRSREESQSPGFDAPEGGLFMPTANHDGASVKGKKGEAAGEFLA